MKRTLKWTLESVRATLQERVARGLPINPTSLYAEIPSLYRAVRYHLGGWDSVYQDASLNPVRLQFRRTKETWTKDLVLARVRAACAQGIDLRAIDLLVKNARHFFGTMVAALIAAAAESVPANEPAEPAEHADLAQRVRARRQQMGLTQATLAQRSGLHPNEIGLIESGQRGNGHGMRVGSLVAIAKALGVSVDYLVR